MRKRTLALVLGVSTAGCLDARDAEPAAVYQPIPDGYHWLQDDALLSAAVADGDRAAVRPHGWYLWAGIMQPARGLDWPVWFTWPNTTGAFRAAAAARADAAPHGRGLRGAGAARRFPDVNVPGPCYPIPPSVFELYPEARCTDKDGNPTVCDGAHFQFNGDVMIPTESLSLQGFEWIRSQRLYEAARLDELRAREHELAAPHEYVVTKHMYWPVKDGQLGVVPVWRDDFPPSFEGYAGYETWGTVVAVDPANARVGETAEVQWLHGVFARAAGSDPCDPPGPEETRTDTARVHGIDEFYAHQVTPADWRVFDAADKAILEAACQWAYGQSFEPGDWLVTVAMHVNTKEIPTWSLQSVWWSDTPDEGPYAADRPAMPAGTVGPWDRYLMVTSYGIPELDGALPVAMNPYIELVIHPVATNCQNCHARAGWPTGSVAGTASYQNPDCPDPLKKLEPGDDCLEGLLLTDFQWIVPDRAK